MASPLAQTIMKNISKKALNKKDDTSKYDCIAVNNINKKEEEMLKSILDKNNTKINLTSLRNSQLNNNNKSDKVIENKVIEKLTQKSENKINKIEMKSLKSLDNNSNNNSVKQSPKDKQNKNMISLKDLAK